MNVQDAKKHMMHIRVNGVLPTKTAAQENAVSGALEGGKGNGV